MCNKEKIWPILCERLGRPEWAEDPRSRIFKDRLANRELVNRLLDEALSARTTAEWLAHGRRANRQSAISRTVRTGPRRSAWTPTRCCASAASQPPKSPRCGKTA
jgi:hypothetical protein